MILFLGQIANLDNKMSPIPWNETKPVANFALGMQGASRVENGNVISRRSSNSSDFDNNRNIHITSSNDDLVSVKSSVSRGSKRLVPLSHPAVDVPLCMECQVDNYLVLTYYAFCILQRMQFTESYIELIPTYFPTLENYCKLQI